MTSPSLFGLPLWERHVERVWGLLTDALRLFVQSDTPESEGDLNRQLYFCLLKANRANMGVNDNWFEFPPTYEGRQAPGLDTSGHSSESKIPDYQWGMIDHEEPDPLRSARLLVVECKRLGDPTPAGWVFNVQYVQSGILRFVDDRWRYGKSVSSGFMIGYLQSQSVPQALDEVNSEVAGMGLPLLMQTRADARLVEFEHSLVRGFQISPFRLVHLWVDLTTK